MDSFAACNTTSGVIKKKSSGLKKKKNTFLYIVVLVALGLRKVVGEAFFTDCLTV